MGGRSAAIWAKVLRTAPQPSISPLEGEMSRKRQRGVKGVSPKAADSVLCERVHPSLPLSGHLPLKGRGIAYGF